MATAAARIAIPTDPASSGSYKQRLAEALLETGTRIYIDTSFLMWMTKIGSTSRQQLLEWLRTTCGDRIHVPTWSAHEYLRHHTAGTIVTELKTKTDEVSGFVQRTYNYFRPFVDEPIGRGGENPASLRASTRDALNSLDRLVTVARQWDGAYPSHAKEIIGYINERALDVGELYANVENIELIGEARFGGRIPPGFQDRNKKGLPPGSGQDDDGFRSGSNRFGDLLFWKEVLAHAQSAGATAIALLTNDRKNDWHMGGSSTGGVEQDMLELRKQWKPVPRIHPMLALEAQAMAGVGEVLLIDSPYLAAMLRDIADDQVSAFCDVAINPDPPRQPSETERRSALQEEQAAETATADAAKIEAAGWRFLDAPAVKTSTAALSRALFASRDPLSEAHEALLTMLRNDVDPITPAGEVFTAERLDGFDHQDLARLSRAIHDRVTGANPGFAEPMADIIALLDELPPATASALYLGFLASMYLQHDSGDSRIPPRSPAADLLLARQTRPYGAVPVEVIAKRLESNSQRPLYVPSVDLPRLEWVIDIEPDTNDLDVLRSLRLAGHELLTPAQAEDGLQLSALFEGSEQIEAAALLGKACELYALPHDQLAEGDTTALFTLTPTIGFRAPATVFIVKEEG